MQTIRALCEVDQYGVARVEVPPSFGKQVELIVLPIGESKNKSLSDGFSSPTHTGDIAFAAATYLAVVEDDQDEDAIWESYLNE